jgi:TonB family protein
MKTLLIILIPFITLSILNAQTEDSAIYQVVEDMPRFPGCEYESKEEQTNCSTGKMLKFIYGELIYPAEAKQRKTEGTVVVQFVINKDGSISNAKIVKEIGDGCGEEVLRIVSKMPNWEAGMQRGIPVKVRYTLPVKFRLE